MVNVLPIATGLPDSPWAYRNREDVPQGIFLQYDGDGFRIDHFHSDPETVRQFVCSIRSEAQALTDAQAPRSAKATE